MNRSHDVVVIGSGPAGAAAAHYLAREGLGVLLLNKAAFPREKVCGDCLTPRALGVLKDMGILDDVDRVGHRLTGLHVRAGENRSFAARVPAKDGLPDYMIALPRKLLDDIIRKRAMASGAEFQGSVYVTHITPDSNGVRVQGKCHGQPTDFRARVAVVATGADVRLLLRLGVIRNTPPMVIAARTYFQGLSGLTDHIQIDLESLPAGDYGWVFPLSQAIANVGVALWPGWRAARRTAKSARTALVRFAQTHSLGTVSSRAFPASAPRVAPIRIDFLSVPAFGSGFLLVGEAAGLANPLTGGGTDFALESGKLAAEHLLGMFKAGDFSQLAHQAYDRLIRQRFRSLFLGLRRSRALYVNRLCVNRIVQAASRSPEVRSLVLDSFLGYQHGAAGASLQMILKLLTGR